MATGPLDGIKLLEFTQIIAGPMGCQMLSDLGAEVIKVEPIEGEPWRLNVQFVPKESVTFIGLNRGKKSFALNLAHPASREAVHKLVAEMDVVVINYRPDVAARLGIDYETLAAIKPDVIYVDNTAFGREGEWADRPGYDIVVQAASGLTAAVGKVDDAGTPLVPPAVADTTTAYAIVGGVLAALFYRERTGKGQKVETSLLINALNISMSQFQDIPLGNGEQRALFLAALAEARATGLPYAEFLKKRDDLLGRSAGGNVYYRCFLTQDGALAIGALSASLRDKVRKSLGFEHNRDEPGYNPADPEQMRVDQAIRHQVEAQFLTKTTAEWEKILTDGGVPVAPVLFVQELIDHPVVQANNYVVEVEHELVGPIRMQAPPWKMSVSNPTPQGASPVLGRHNEEILAGLGYSAEQIAEMRSAGAIL
jgi:CoA:oxalate CoA-transferase